MSDSDEQDEKLKCKSIELVYGYETMLIMIDCVVIDRRIFAAVREDDVDQFIEICGEGEEELCDINYYDGCVSFLVSDCLLG